MNVVNKFLKFLNQQLSRDNRKLLASSTETKEFNEAWDYNWLLVHSSFSTSLGHFIGKRGDFYQNLTLLYHLSNETCNIRSTTDWYKNILFHYTNFDIQLCFTVNYQKSYDNKLHQYKIIYFLLHFFFNFFKSITTIPIFLAFFNINGLTAMITL